MEKEISKEEQEKLKKEIEEIYTPLSVAKKELEKRWKDEKLKKKVDDFLKGDIPEFLKNNPKAYFARHIISPNFDFLLFLKKVTCAEIDFVCPEYKEDKFVSKNINKYHLCKLYFHDGVGKNGGRKIDTLKIVDFNKSEGKKFKEIKTLWGENFIDFHHRLLCSLIPEINEKIFDVSKWIKKNGKQPDKFYNNFLVLFLRNGILFENFLLNKEEKDFTKNVVLENFKKIEKYFGIKPLVVHLLPVGKETDQSWLCYPGFIKEIIKNSKVIKK